MIKEVYGNILLSKSNAIVQSVAVDEDFSSGLAASVKNQWPGIADDFEKCCCKGEMRPGDLWRWQNDAGVDVINLLTHDATTSASLEYTDSSLEKLAALVKEAGLKSLAVPKIGTDVGGLDWREVKPLIEKHLGELNIPVYLYTIFSPNIAAVEE